MCSIFMFNNWNMFDNTLFFFFRKIDWLIGLLELISRLRTQISLFSLPEHAGKAIFIFILVNLGHVRLKLG